MNNCIVPPQDLLLISLTAFGEKAINKEPQVKKMRTLLARILLVALIILVLGLSAGKSRIPSGGIERQKGISYAAWAPGLYSTPDSDLSLVHLAETGANWISLIVTCYQNTLSTTQISATAGTPTDDDLVHVIRQAHGLGLKVMLKPHVDLWNDPAHWRGEIGTAFKGEAEWSSWFSSYQAFILHYADLASAQGADQFCIGTELQGTSGRATDWRKIVAEVRAHYSGPLVYAANHSGEEIGISWWDAVDIIGVDAYYALASKSNPTAPELEAAWRPHVAALAQLAATWQKPIILTEIGYRSLDGAASHPWDWQIEGQIDLKEQADAYKAAFESVYNQPWFSGIFWWSWNPDPWEGGADDDGYTPHDKPAEDVLRSWFGVPPRCVSPSAPESNEFRLMDIYTEGLSSGWVDQSWGADYEFHATDPVRSSAYSLRARLSPWGALSFWHPPFTSTPYYWLEFAIRGSPGGNPPQLSVYFYDRTGAVLHMVSMNNRRYLSRGTVEPGIWKVVSIPLRDLAASRKILSRVSLQDSSGRGSNDFWIDDLRLVGARWKQREELPARRR